ncbi:hypothetical protein Vafri_6176 [Volvox africanus]|uniref:Uncharacterized protein n=1 Tax=Volvox africanus TaxID=51714 RepID=A0A8J4AYK6_9CHLO|nr:hypothetical protein Vafri_6176 [Volvox africanus]
MSSLLNLSTGCVESHMKEDLISLVVERVKGRMEPLQKRSAGAQARRKGYVYVYVYVCVYVCPYGHELGEGHRGCDLHDMEPKRRPEMEVLNTDFMNNQQPTTNNQLATYV